MSSPRLVHAAFQGDLARLAALLDTPASIHSVDKSAPDALHAAIENDHPGCVELLLDRGADPNRTSNGLTALAHAVDVAIDCKWQEQHALGDEPTRVIIQLLVAGADPKPGLKVAREYGSERIDALLSSWPPVQSSKRS